MRTELICVLASTLVSTFGWAEDSLVPKDIPAPDGSYTLKLSDGVQVLDSGRSSLVTLARSLEGVQYVDAKWSSDSHLVVVVFSYNRGSGIEAAYSDGSGWHKTLQPDTDLPIDELSRQAGVSGWLVAQHCHLGAWLDPRRILVVGELTFSGQKKVPYEYTLIFTGGPFHLDRGGFEEGAIRGIGYHLR